MSSLLPCHPALWNSAGRVDNTPLYLLSYEMVRERSLFDNLISDNTYNIASSTNKKEGSPLERLKNLEEKIANAVEKVKALKEEKNSLEKRITELETLLNEKNQEVESLRSEKTVVKNQVEELLNELETLEL